MKKASTVVMLAMLLVFVGGTIAAAADFYTEFNYRVARQQERIDNGIRKGQLTQSESQVVQDNLNWIKGEEARLRGEGALTPREQKRIMKMLAENSNMIANKKKNYRRLY